MKGNANMNSEQVKQVARANTPEIAFIRESDSFRHHVINGLRGSMNKGVELGVAGGVFSQRMVESGKFSHFYGVDRYGDHHDVAEYKRALRHIGLESNYRLLRMSFENALDLFPDNYFDFIYSDGYAHTGEEGGQTLVDWYKKLKTGGIMAGDDYHEDWPLVKWAVNSLVLQLGATLHVTGKTETTNLSFYPSWYFIKPDRSVDGLQLNPLLQHHAAAEKARLATPATAL